MTKKHKATSLADATLEVPESGWAFAGASAQIAPAAVTDPSVLRAGRNLTEAVRQGVALAEPGTRQAEEIARLLQETTARKHGLQFETAMKQAITAPDVFKAVEGPHPTGKAAEFVVSRAYKDLHASQHGEVVNPPKSMAPNFVDARISPDSASRRDILFQVKGPSGVLLTVPGGQVKTGSGQYLADSLASMAQTPGYGRTAYVDARFVEPDGSPRVAPDGFTKAQARKLREARVVLRGIRELDRQSEELVGNLRQFRKDGSEPVARAQLQRLRNDIAAAYRAEGVTSRMLGGAAIAAAASMVSSLAVQILSDGKVDLLTVARSAAGASLVAGASTLADASLYQLATWLGETPEVARTLASQGVAAGFFVVAAGTDAVSEMRAVVSGRSTGADAAMGTSVKVVLDALPLVLMPLGLMGLPLALAGQFGGRWLLQRSRQDDATIRQSCNEAEGTARQLSVRVESIQPSVERLRVMSDEVDEIHAQLMQGNKSSGHIIQ
ncbi:hypothetical protein [Corallococcus sp. AS-1-6]|uniref:hypothetical protein n=1 Tax=Corallococcus sp. AS-1-6 TaxID=2874599 RepID=UPI001CBCAEEF|nr:hypothetical protein [Corallococcus sp. AS-1-6]MBZ4370210.1 hypothetical protein [Corallococcus sp. AS-1-6]